MDSRCQKYVATMRPKSVPRGTPVDAFASKGKLSSPVNKRNATYLNEEEYDEDLAQLDLLLHYVNNLSASLEFLQWENKRISTDLMPSLLSMYDAMYAKLSMNDEPHIGNQFETNKSPFKESPSQLGGRLLYINEVDSTRRTSISEGSRDCRGVQGVEKKCIRMNQSGISTLGDSSPDHLISELDDRPLSSISSSSSCSSNSIRRDAAGSYMASVESLENGSLVETTRRRDRKIIKARREKLRTGSSDSGVQCHIISLPAPSTLRRRYCEPDLSYMDRIVLEILETEELYVRDLEEVIEGYLNYWKSNPQPEIELDALESLFSNIEEIFNFNREFLTKLSLCGTDPVCVARCFVRHNRGFAIYTDYCTNYPRTVSILTNLMRNEQSMRSCRERQMALGHTLPLGSYLLKPVQRILKYHLLLGNIIKNFPKENLGYDDIWNALSAMTGMAHHINDMKRKHEHAVRVQEIQSLLYGWDEEDLTTFGELAAEGTFRIHGHKGLRHVFLFDKMLLVAKKKDQNILAYKSHILCSNLMLIEAIPGEPLCFHAIPFDNPREQFTLAVKCRSQEQKREWTQQLKRVILENYAADIPAHARQLVMELGQVKSDGLNNIEPRVSRRAHHAPEYLEKRNDRRRASEVGLKCNKLPTTNKPKSRSSSCNRTSMRKISASSLSPFDRKQIRLPLWKRRSQPGEDISSKDVPKTPDLPSSLLRDKHSDIDQLSDSRDEILMNKESENANENSPTEPSPAKEENLHDIVTHLLQHRLEMQKKILNKQRRNLISKKQVSPGNGSDTDDDRPPLPVLPPPTNARDLCTRENQWSSEANSNRSSVNSLVQCDMKPNDSIGSQGRDVNSNYDNVNEIWHTLWSKFPPDKPISSKGQSIERNFSLTELPSHGEESFAKERPKTVVSTECAIDAYNVLNNYLEQSERTENNYKFVESNGNQNFAEYLYDSEEESCGVGAVHPNHKIYKRLPLNKGNIRKILGRLAGHRSHHKSNGELSSVSGRSIDSCSVTSTKTSIVSTVAKHYSKALREKVRQLTHEDDSKKNGDCYGNSIGARLASSHEQFDYAVPNVKSTSNSRPDSVLSSSSFRTCSSSSSGLPQLKSDSKSKCSDETGTLGDSYYEHCFDATDFENELFRDSAIYSDPEDTDVSLSPLSSFRLKNSRKVSPSKISQAISRQSSFRHSYNFGSDLPNIQRAMISPPDLPSKTKLFGTKQLDVMATDSKIQPKSNRISPLYSSTRIRTGTYESNAGRKRDFVLRNGWVKHIVDKLQDQND